MGGPHTPARVRRRRWRSAAIAQVAAGPLLDRRRPAAPAQACSRRRPGSAPARSPSRRTAAPSGPPTRRATTITAHRVRGPAARARRSTSAARRSTSRSRPTGASRSSLTAVYDRPGLAVVDLRSGAGRSPRRRPRALRRRALAPTAAAPTCPAAGPHGTLTRVDRRTGMVHAPIELGAHSARPRAHPDGKHALVALNGESRRRRRRTSRRPRVRRRSPPRRFPTRLAVAPDGRSALVTPQRLRRPPGHAAGPRRRSGTQARHHRRGPGRRGVQPRRHGRAGRQQRRGHRVRPETSTGATGGA